MVRPLLSRACLKGSELYHELIQRRVVDGSFAIEVYFQCRCFGIQDDHLLIGGTSRLRRSFYVTILNFLPDCEIQQLTSQANWDELGRFPSCQSR